jgi:hypothetical protein
MLIFGGCQNCHKASAFWEKLKAASGFAPIDAPGDGVLVDAPH